MASQNMHFVLEDPAHPGELLGELLDDLGWTQAELARRTGLTPKTVSEIRNTKAPVTPATAVILERVLGRAAAFWLGVQSQFDEASVRNAWAQSSSRLQEWAASFPVKWMRKMGLLSDVSRGNEADAVLRFLGVASPDAWDRVWESTHVAYRQTRKFETSENAIAAWVRCVELHAHALERTIKFRDFDVEAAVDLVPRARALTRVSASEMLAPLQEACASAGIAFVVVPSPPKTGISGCTRWISRKRVVIGLTARYKSDDQFWFSFFHELGHVVLHRGGRPLLVDNAVESFDDGVVDPLLQEEEEEANRFAANCLISPDVFQEFVSGTADFDNDAVYDFADAIGIAPGIVVGRLQKDGYIAYHQGNALKQRLNIDIEGHEEATM